MSGTTTATPTGNTGLPLLGDGGPLRAAFDGVRALLLNAFPKTRFRHAIVQPRMSAQRWSEMARNAPLVGASMAMWTPSEKGAVFRGDVIVPVFLLTSAADPQDLLLGTARMPGVAGMMAAAIFALHGRRIEGIGKMDVVSASNVETTDWISDRIGIATLSVAVRNVGFDNEQMAQTLQDFGGIGGTWTFDTGASTVEGEL